ncbi:HD domain-containing protein [Microbulbifer sp. DLAB2-AF]|uniref:HD domain-containing protein n=1 Tax=Microbulbifer sp. DLAB2-AF TaxID=3243395 RepID=UPI0040391D70
MDNLDAPQHLINHVTLVGEAADLLIKKFIEMKVNFDPDFVRVGVVIHDIGKIIHTNEMYGPGSQHEPEGERILLSKGFTPAIARCCLSHARWSDMECTIEELAIALSDKLWKGKRVEELELQIIDRISHILDVERWDIFSELDLCFESIAIEGLMRLQRSVTSG